MKIGLYGIDYFSDGKENIVDPRLDEIKKIARSAKKVAIQVEVVTDFDRFKECNGLIVLKEKQTDLVINDLDFMEKRFANSQDEREKTLLNRLKVQLEKEDFIYKMEFSEEESKYISNYSLLTGRAVFIIESQEAGEKSKVLAEAYNFCGYIAFLTAGEKEARAWSIKKGMTAWDAAGVIHSDIQRGFIRAEVIAYNDLIADGGINQARSNNHQRLEGKDYVMQDGDVVNFRFNK